MSGLKSSAEPKKRYVQLPDEMTDTAAWTALSDRGVWLYIELRKSFNYNDGGNSCLKLPYSKVKWRMAPATYKKGMQELVHYGFVRRVKIGGLLGGATVYALCERWKDKSIQIVDKEGREAIKMGLVKKPNYRNVSGNLNGHRPHEKKKRREKNQMTNTNIVTGCYEHCNENDKIVTNIVTATLSYRYKHCIHLKYSRYSILKVLLFKGFKEGLSISTR